MKILFIDPSNWNYDTTTPSKQPLGGTQSALVYLAKELALLGHEPVIINAIPEPAVVDVVSFVPMPCSTDFLNSHHVVVNIAKPMAGILRGIGCTRPVVLWASHATNQPAVFCLADAKERDLYAGFAMVSAWQAEQYRAKFGINATSQAVLRNAAGPAFLQRTPKPRWFQSGRAPIFGYSSTPYRGLDVLLMAFPLIRKHIPDATLRIYSNMGIYSSDIHDEFSSLYELARGLAGVQYVGSLPQPQLADALADIDIWTYPCTFPETSCISAMEAMAVGQLLVTTTLGALPETTAGFAVCHELDSRGLAPIAATNFAGQVVKAIRDAEANPGDMLAKISQEVSHVNTHYTWKLRAVEWVEWLERLLRQ